MRAKVLGKGVVNYVSKKTNQPVKGVTLHLGRTESAVEGLAVESVFISAKSDCFEKVAKLPLNSDVDVQYNRWGNVDNVVLWKA